MTTQTTPEATTTCPSWCTLTPGHPWDSDGDDDSSARGHQGPKFGPYVSAGSFEYPTHPGVQLHEINVDDFVTHSDLLAEDAADLARNLLAAAQ